ncbi:nucleotidyltransferase domain-containing protein [Frankia tisae]|uniref:nucleotidyltransferase domain-containing protein n=1 Tax=Frankia tisae TaxID=2950104 RepID=UPI0021BE0E48|nr:nucleotidyltransferase domain-containing protein [Frankia tisae]
MLPERESRYLRDVVALLRGLLADRLTAVYLFGSGSYGDYDPGPSDLDVQAFIDGTLEPAVRNRLIEELDHTVLPCPARRLEFVCYDVRDVTPVARHPHYQLNLNTGTDIARHVSTDPSTESSHWFLLDLAIGRDLGRVLYGPSPVDLLTAVPRAWQLSAILDSLSWHDSSEPATPNRVLNACRSWRYAETESWGSKLQGARWVATHHPDLTVVSAALTSRHDYGTVDPHAADALATRTRTAVNAAIKTTTASP